MIHIKNEEFLLEYYRKSKKIINSKNKKNN
jgi:hypothetical protein